MKKRTKLSILGAVVIGLTAVGVTAATTGGPDPVDVRVETVEPHDLVAAISASGKIQPRNRVNLSSDITGRIVSLRVREGMMVEKGQVLLTIDPEQFSAAVARAEAQLASTRAGATQTEANAVQAEREYTRLLEVQKSHPGSVSAEQLEQARTRVDVSKASLEASRHSVAQALAGLRDAQNNLAKTTILAPMSGRVTRLVVAEGETAIMGNLNKDAATLLTISDMSVLETRVRVDETDVARIEIGDSTVVELDAFPERSFVGRVVQISNSSVRGAAAAPTADQAVDYEVTIQLLDAPEETRPDFSATARIITDTRHDVLSIPIIALTVRERTPLGDSAASTTIPATGSRAGGAGPMSPADGPTANRDVEGVFVVGPDNKVTFRPVKIGVAGEKYFEVLEGLQRGERIVAGTYQAIKELQDGTVVRPSQALPAPLSKS